ncbi:MAG: cadherin domain-containing protein, partial [Desulfobacterales bacterium]|nr:cadherin domain-containing protein [Desulfobacterales bacterium]
MKIKIIQWIYITLVLVLPVLVNNNVLAVPCYNCNASKGINTKASNTTDWSNVGSFNGGDYIRFKLLAGGNYSWQTCNTPNGYDSELTLFTVSCGGTAQVSQDDSCGLGATISYNAPVDQYVWVLITKYSCLNDSTPIILEWKGPNTAPTFISSTTIYVEENQTVFSVSATDAEENGLTYSITGGADMNQFSINSSTGALTFNTPPDYENPNDADPVDHVYDVVVKVTDTGNLFASQTIAVTVLPVNEAPTITSSASVSVPEDQINVMTVTATDPENNALAYSITGGTDASKFTINVNTGVITFLTAPDHENPHEYIYNVQVSVSDGSLTTSQSITVTVTDVVEPRYNVTITSANSNGYWAGGNPDIWFPTANGSTVSVTEIGSRLDNGKDVIVTTNTEDAGQGDIVVNSAIQKTEGASATLTLKAYRGISFTQGGSISSISNALALNVVLWSRYGGDNAAADARAGSVWLSRSTSIATNGGNITIGGGLDPSVGYALGINGTSDEDNAVIRGVSINGNITTNGGNIQIKGRGCPDVSSAGVSIAGNISTITTGTISINGIAKGTSDGIAIGDSSLSPTAGSVCSVDGTITLIGSIDTSGNAININGGSDLTSSGTGNIVLTSSLGHLIGTTGWISSGGMTTITAPSTHDITLNHSSNNFTGAVTVVSGNTVTLVDTNALTLGSVTAINLISSAGALTLTGAINTTNINLTSTSGDIIGTAGRIIATGVTSITAPSANNITLDNSSNDFTGAVTVVSGNTVTLKDMNALTLGSVTASGTLNLTSLAGHLTLTGAITTTNINLTSTSGDIIGISGYIIASGITSITAPSANNITLSNSNNDFTGAVTVVSGNTLMLTDKNALSLGAIAVSGTIDIASGCTEAGNLTLSGAVTTANTSANALILNAGKAASAGTGSGGNIIISGGTINVGSGRATFFSGSIANSTGLTTLIVSGSGRFRYNSDETATNYTTALSTGNYAIYREQPILTVSADSQSINYSNSPSSPTTSVSGFQNGDTRSLAVSTEAGVALAATQSTAGYYSAGTHSLNPSGASGGLGYAFSYASGALIVSPIPLTIVFTGVDKIYDTFTTATVTTTDNRKTNDVFTINRTAAFENPNAGTGKTVNVSGISLSGTDAGNYTVSSTGSTTATISKATPTITTWPTASPITYGQTVSTSTLTGATPSVPGSFTFNTPDIKPNAGTASYAITFTPTDTANYLTVSGSISVTVNKATPTITTWPTASALIYGQLLSESSLTGGISSVPGTFAFTTPDTKPNAGAAIQSVTFTPADTANYSPVIGTVTVTVTKATPTVSAWPTASAISYGQTLSDASITGSTASVPGTFAFTTTTTKPNAGTASHAVTFTPTDTANYNTVSGTVSVMVNKATPTISTWPTASIITFGQTLSESTLTGGTGSVPGT